MNKFLIFIIAILISNVSILEASNKENKIIEVSNDSIRLSEINKYWIELIRTVKEGDFEGYKAAYHNDAIVIFTYGKNSTSVKIESALNGWKQGFLDTKSGKVINDVKFRFSQRIGNENTAHETGIFQYTSKDKDGKELVNIMIHFEMLLLKQNGSWYGLMEYQKSFATQEEWDSLQEFKG